MTSTDEPDTCVTCGCPGLGTTAETGCTCDTCHAQPGDTLGWLGPDLPRAYDTALEIATEWRTRIRLTRDDRGLWIATVPS